MPAPPASSSSSRIHRGQYRLNKCHRQPRSVGASVVWSGWVGLYGRPFCPIYTSVTASYFNGIAYFNGIVHRGSHNHTDRALASHQGQDGQA